MTPKFAKDINKIFPQCTIKLARFRGKDKSNDFIDNQRISGNAFQLIKAADAFAARHLPIASHFVEGQIKRVDQPAVPTLALREALINAISHRLYTIYGSTISLAIYDDRLELWNAGKLSPHLKLEDLRISHDSFPRNERIAMIFYQRGWIEMWGTGTTRMIDFCIKNKSPEPEFYEYSSGFSVVFRFKEPMHTDISTPSPDELQELSPRQKEILRLLEQSDEMTMQEIHNCLSNPPATSTLGKDLTLLKSCGLIASQGGSKATVWKSAQKK